MNQCVFYYGIIISLTTCVVEANNFSWYDSIFHFVVQFIFSSID